MGKFPETIDIQGDDNAGQIAGAIKFVDGYDFETAARIQSSELF